MTGEAPTNGLASHLAAHEALNVTAKIDDHGRRIDALESIADQLRGAKAVIVFLIGSNLLLAASVVVTLLK